MVCKLKTPALSSLIGQWFGQNIAVTVVPPDLYIWSLIIVGFNYGKCSHVYCLNLIIHPATDSIAITVCWMRELQFAVWWRELLVCRPGQLWPWPIPSPSCMPDHSISLTRKCFGGGDLNRTTQRWRCCGRSSLNRVFWGFGKMRCIRLFRRPHCKMKGPAGHQEPCFLAKIMSNSLGRLCHLLHLQYIVHIS